MKTKAIRKNRLTISLMLIIAIILVMVTSFCYAEASSKFYTLEELTGVEINVDSLGSYINQSFLSQYDEDTVVRVIIKLKQDSLLTTYNEVYFDGSYSDYLESKVATEELVSIQEAQASVKTAILDSGINADFLYSYQNALNAISMDINLNDLIKLSTVSSDISTITLCQEYYELSEDVYSTSQTQGIIANTASLKGDGMVVAVIDASLDTSHAVFSNIESTSLSLTREVLSNSIASLNASTYSNISENTVYVSDKIPYAYDYGEKDLDVYSSLSSHGTHVSGILTGSSQSITGVAPNAQLAFMKVADANGSMYTDSIIAALEDCLVLNVDVVNMSLGSNAGFSTEAASEDPTMLSVINSLKANGTTVVCAAGNAATAAEGSASGTNSTSTNIDNGTISSPASYDSSLSIANAEYEQVSYMVLNDTKIFVNDAVDENSNSYNFIETLLETTDGTEEYVVIPGLGNASDYEGLDVTGKIVVVARGTISFTDKAKYAAAAGAKAIIIYNNVSGTINAQATNAGIPVTVVSLSVGNILKNAQTKTLLLDSENKCYTMASSSSSGVLEDLSLGIDLTSWGTNVYSSINDQGYAQLTGTSMASPNVAGAMTLIKQYIKQNNPTFTTQQISTLATQYAMSNTSLMSDYDGVYYSPRVQGAGIVNVEKVVNSKTYLVTDENSDKVKIELGDDDDKTGIYEFSFKVVNTATASQTYTVDVTTLTEKLVEGCMSGYDYKLSPTVYVDGVSSNIISVDASSSKTVTIKIVLSSQDITYLEQYKNGIYVEGYVGLTSATDSVSLPFIGFYGNWEAADLLDATYYEIDALIAEGNDDATAAIRATTSYGIYAGQYYVPMGVYAYNLPDGYEGYIQATSEKAALSIFDTSMYALGYVQLGLLRNSQLVKLSLVDNTTGEIIWEDEQDYVSKTTYNDSYGMQLGGDFVLSISPYNMNLYNNSMYTLKCEVYFGDDEDQVKETYSQKFSVDMESPELVEGTITTEQGKKYANLTVFDNQFIQTIAICGGTTTSSGITLTPFVFNPVTTQAKGKTVNLKYDITEYINQTNNGKIYFYIQDYAFNTSVYYIETSQSNSSNSTNTNTTTNTSKEIVFTTSMVELNINKTTDLTSLLKGYDDTVSYTWTSSNKAIAVVENGLVAAFSQGITAITVLSPSGSTASIIIKVIDNPELNGSSPDFKTINISGVEMVKTLSDDESSLFNVSLTNKNIKLAVGESILFNYTVTPWSFNTTGCYLEVTTKELCTYLSIENGVVNAIANGDEAKLVFTYKNANGDVLHSFESNFTITTYEDKYVSEDDTLVAYFGNESIVDLSTSSFTSVAKDAFKFATNVTTIILPDSCKMLSNGALSGLTHLTSINLNNVAIIGEGAFSGCTSLSTIDLTKVSYVRKNAFNGCEVLSDVTISSENIDGINTSSFINCKSLTQLKVFGAASINSIVRNGELVLSLSETEFDGVTKIANNVYKDRLDITTLDLSTSSITTIGDYAFSGCTNLTSIILPSTLTKIGQYAFDGCTSLTNVEVQGTQAIEVLDYAFSSTKISTIDFSQHEMSFGDYVFYNCASLVYAQMGIVKNMGEETFNKASNLTRVEFEEGTTVIGDYTFAPYLVGSAYDSHDSLIYVSVPSTVTTIGDYAFAVCDYIDFTNCDFTNVETIGKQSFYGITSLKEMSFPNATEIGYGAFAQSSLIKISLNSVETIGELAFYYCENLKSVKLPSVEGAAVEVLEGAFYNCTSLVAQSSTPAFGPGGITFITDGIDFSRITSIGDAAFYKCTSLTSANLTTVKTIGFAAFANDSALKKVTFPVVEQIGNSAFGSCALTSIAVPNTLVEIGEQAFAINEELSITASSTLSNKIKIVEGALYKVLEDETSMVLIYYPMNSTNTNYTVLDNTIMIGGLAFAGNASIKNVTIPKSIQVIGDGAFYNCTSLTALTILSNSAPTLYGSYTEEKGIYSNFVSYLSSNNESVITVNVPQNASGYLNNQVWSSYCTINFISVSDPDVPSGSSNLSKLQTIMSALPSVNNLSSSNISQINQAKSYYEQLTDEEKAEFEETDLYDKYIASLAKIDELSDEYGNVPEDEINQGKFPIATIITLSILGAILLLIVTVFVATIISHKINKNKNQ